MNIEIVYAAKAAAEAYDVPVAWVAALIDKESNGIVLNDVDDEKCPTVRFEGHYFDARLTGAARDKARAAGLAASKAGKIKNPKSQADRWHKLIAPAAAIDADAAYESVSWGVGQVMGAHWKKLGFASVGELVKAAMSGLAGQVDLMMRYLKAFELLDELRRGDALGLARGYNGPANARAYATDLQERANTYGADSASLTAVSGMLRQGMRGAAVRDLQALLTRAGSYTARIDGDFGPTTKAAVRTFQRRSGLTDDGVAGPETMRALATYRTAPTEALAARRPSPDGRGASGWHGCGHRPRCPRSGQAGAALCRPAQRLCRQAPVVQFAVQPRRLRHHGALRHRWAADRRRAGLGCRRLGQQPAHRRGRLMVAGIKFAKWCLDHWRLVIAGVAVVGLVVAALWLIQFGRGLEQSEQNRASLDNQRDRSAIDNDIQTINDRALCLRLHGGAECRGLSDRR